MDFQGGKIYARLYHVPGLQSKGPGVPESSAYRGHRHTYPGPRRCLD